MALNHSPQTVTNGLVFYYDMGNPQKSWIGRPTTNFVNAASVSINRYNNPGFSGSVFNTGETFKGMPVWETVFTPQDSTFIPRLASTEGFGAFHAMGTSLTVNTRYMASIYFRLISPLQVSGTQGFNNTYSNISAWGQNGTTSTRYEEDGWIRLYSQYINTSSTLTDNKFWKITFDTTGVQAGQSLRAQWSCPMIEQHDTVYPSTFVNGTRSNTQAITDLTGNNTITATALTYNNDGTFSFNGSSNDLTLSGPVSNFFTDFSSQQISLDVWINIPSSATWTNGFFGNILSRGSFAGSVGLWRTTSNNQVAAYFRQSGATFAAVQSSATIQRDVWTNLVATWTGNTLTLYVNGVSVSVNTGTLGTPTVANWTIGNVTAASGNSGNRFQGSNSIVKIYNRALSAAEVQQNFNALRERYGL
jgi:hypothetical protein